MVSRLCSYLSDNMSSNCKFHHSLRYSNEMGILCKTALSVLTQWRKYNEKKMPTYKYQIQSSRLLIPNYDLLCMLVNMELDTCLGINFTYPLFKSDKESGKASERFSRPNWRARWKKKWRVVYEKLCHGSKMEYIYIYMYMYMYMYIYTHISSRGYELLFRLFYHIDFRFPISSCIIFNSGWNAGHWKRKLDKQYACPDKWNRQCLIWFVYV